MNTKKILQAGEIAKQIKAWIKPQIKKGMHLLEIAEKIEAKIYELGGKPAFPTNTSINEIAAHYTPSHDDKTKAQGLLKIDFGIHIDGWIADTAFSVDLENSEENKKIIQASEDALKNAIDLIKLKKDYGKKFSRQKGERSGGDVGNSDKIGEGENFSKSKKITTSEIGKTIQKTIENYGFVPVNNLSGHEMDEYILHAGLSIPNVDDKREFILEKGLYAIEPFATSGGGKVYDGKPSGIYILTDSRNIRSPIAREILKFIQKEYQTLPFCSRWLVKKFGTKALFGLKHLEENGNLHQFPQLIEVGKGKVAQTENTILIDDKSVIITTD